LQLPQEPPQPLEPQDLFEQLGVHKFVVVAHCPLVQTLSAEEQLPSLAQVCPDGQFTDADHSKQESES